ncbi:MAG TPA: CHAT domain-containing protein, partial [Thermoanaerobaculia bacterium]
MEYHDFTIDIRSTEGGGFEAAVAQAPIRNYHRVHFAAPLSSDVLELLHDSFDRPGDEIGQEAAKIPSPRQIGEQVFTALFQGSLGELFLRCRDMSRDGNAGLRLRLRFRTDDPEAEHLAAIPWEWLWDPHCGDFLATDPYTPVVREIAASHRLSTLEGEPPLRILVVDAAPKTMKELGLKLELERMTEALAPLIAAGQVELLSCARATPEGMRDALLEGDVNVLHLMGHGGYDSGSGTGAVFFVDHEGKEDQVDG